MTIQTARDWTIRLFDTVGISSTKKQHAGRVKGAQIAEDRGVKEEQIRRGGRWNADQMTGCYLTTLPREFMRGVADFEPDYPGSYFLPRESCIPPPCLLQRIWPQLDGWRAAHLKSSNAGEQVEPNMAAGAFLELLSKLRVVLLQVYAKLSFF